MAFEPSDHTFAVCAYGESIFLRECLESLCAQEVKSNIIVCTSTPNNFINDLCVQFGVPLFVSDGESGIGRDWNRALSKVQTPLATIAHQDDVYLPEYSKHLLTSFNSVDDPLLFFCDYGEIRDGKNVDASILLKVKRILLSALKKPSAWNNISLRRRVLSIGSPICCPSVSYNLTKIDRPIFSEHMKCSLDWDAWERISKLDGAFMYEPSVLMRHRIHMDSETSHLIKDNTRSKEDLEMLERFWTKPIALIINKIYGIAQSSNNLG